MIYCRVSLFLSFIMGSAVTIVIGMFFYFEINEHINTIASVGVTLATIIATFISYFVFRSNSDSRRWEINKPFLLGFNEALSDYIEKTGRYLDECIERNVSTETSAQIEDSTAKINQYILLANDVHKVLISKKLFSAIKKYKDNATHLSNEMDIGALGEIDYIENLYTELRNLQASLVQELKTLARINC